MTHEPETNPELRMPHDVILHAEQLIRHDHPVTDPMWKFWSEVADWMNRWQLKGRHEMINAHEWRQFNSCLAAAQSYTEQHEAMEKHCQDPRCDGRQATVQFFPCDGISVLGELRRKVPADTLRIVGQAIVSA